MSSETSLDQLKCPVCTNYFRQKIYICDNKHTICNRCVLKLEKCPMCRCVYNHSNLQRDATLEAELNRRPILCPHCNEEFNNLDYVKHEKTCSQSKIQCPTNFINCHFFDKYSTIGSHLITVHKCIHREPKYLMFVINNDLNSNMEFFFEKWNRKFLVSLTVSKTCCGHSLLTIAPIILTADDEEGESTFMLAVRVEHLMLDGTIQCSLPFKWQNNFVMENENSFMLRKVTKPDTADSEHRLKIYFKTKKHYF